jgi:hypothetical protein
MVTRVTGRLRDGKDCHVTLRTWLGDTYSLAHPDFVLAAKAADDPAAVEHLRSGRESTGWLRELDDEIVEEAAGDHWNHARTLLEERHAVASGKGAGVPVEFATSGDEAAAQAKDWSVARSTGPVVEN